MTQQVVLDVISLGLQTVILASMPPLLIGLAIGLLVSIFQAVTSIQEQTLAFVPKVLAIFLSLIIFGPFMLSTLTSLFSQIYGNFPEYLKYYRK